jgi:superfamily I DNA and/or RNA helicase/very-short-patch-repair endonuclease
MPKDKVQIIIKGEDQTSRIKSWNEKDSKIEITYSDGKTFRYNTDNVRIKHSVLSNDIALNCFNYLKRIAEVAGLTDPRVGNILLNRYNKIDFVSEDNILSAFLTGKLHKTNLTNTEISIYPFGFNISQKVAIDNALTNPLTIIEGPPGTGKTQTILNIIANAVMCGESIAVVSNNNSATANILEKLKKYKLNFIAAYLGNSENKKEFIESQKPYPNLNELKLSPEYKIATLKTLRNFHSTLNSMLEKKNNLSKIRQELESVELEYKHFNEYCKLEDELPSLYLRHYTNSAAALKLWIVCEKYIERGKMPGFVGLFWQFVNRILLGIINKAFYSLNMDTIIAICQKCWYMARIAELSSSVSLLQVELNQSDFDGKMKEYSDLSKKLFYDQLTKKYDKRERQKFEIDDLWKKPEAFISEYPVILSTIYSLRSSLSYKVMYDYVVIDESSQVDIATGALALSCAKKAVIVGDLKQLTNVVNSEMEQKTDNVFNEFNLPEVYRYRDHSLLLSVSELFPDIPRTMLREHYRCHPMIIGFCNQKFYNNQLIVLTEPKSNRQPLIVYKTVLGNHARNNVNQRQIDMIKQEIIPQQKLFDNFTSIGIVTPYRNQTNALQEAFSKTDIKADTVDKFQGRENDVIILSTVDNEITRFTDNANRLNVAVSRAIEQLIVVVNSGENMSDTNIGDLVRYIEYNNLEIAQSKVYSIFDYLYASYREKRNELLHKRGKVSEFDSENLMHILICDVLNTRQFMEFDYAMHYRMKDIIRDMEMLNAEEKQYVENDLTHVDFLIFKKIGKTPKLVIEVDGVAFHAKGSRQAERDRLKNGILQKYGLSYVRFKTDGSNERERLETALYDATGSAP